MATTSGQPPSQTAQWIGTMIARELETFVRELELCENDAVVWATRPGVTNSLGTLTLHICGNLQHFIGGRLGQTGYVRDRDHEFSARDIPRQDLVDLVRTALGVVRNVMPTLTDAQLAQEYPEAVGGVRMLTGVFLTHLVAHTAMHLGQAGYVRRIVSGSGAQSAGPVPMKTLAIT
jgi:hypothetical protein